jgi:hypothetical protein
LPPLSFPEDGPPQELLRPQGLRRTATCAPQEEVTLRRSRP